MPVVPPVLVREEALFGTGMLPDTEQQIYRVPEDGLYLAGTSEVPLASLHGGEMLAEEALPLRYAGLSTCFRREAGAAGKDTRGIFRVHQFDKVEMFAFVTPEESPAEHERLLAIEEELMQALELPYRVVNIAVDDLGASACQEVRHRGVAAGAGALPRAHLVLQHHRLPGPAAGRALPARGAAAAPRHAHTLNGTAVAVGRTIIALAENGQQEDGSVVLPAVLREFGAPERIEPQDG